MNYNCLINGKKSFPELQKNPAIKALDKQFVPTYSIYLETTQALKSVDFSKTLQNGDNKTKQKCNTS